jgi:hypothetical protein
MSTLKELIDTHGLPIKVTNPHYDTACWFEIVATRENYCVGFYQNGAANFMPIHAMAEDWSLYVEPKKKVKRWLWATKEGNITENMRSEEDASVLYPIKLLWSETEFEA